MESIEHNLPAVDTTISYEFVAPYLTIKNVTALTRTGYRYWVAFRARYTATDVLSSIGSITVTLAKYPTKVLFLPLIVSTPRNTIVYSDYRDLAGFHAGMKNFDTQVVSASDNLLENGTG